MSHDLWKNNLGQISRFLWPTFSSILRPAIFFPPARFVGKMVARNKRRTLQSCGTSKRTQHGNLQLGRKEAKGAGPLWYCTRAKRSTRAEHVWLHAFVFPRDEPAQGLARPKYTRHHRSKLLLGRKNVGFSLFHRPLETRAAPKGISKEPDHKSSFSSPRE